MALKEFKVSSDPLVQALQRLVLQTSGGYKAVAEKIEASDQTLYQIVTCRPDSKTGKPKSVGKNLRDRLDYAYPLWLVHGPSDATTSHPSSGQPGDVELAQTSPGGLPLALALNVVLDALAASPAKTELRQLLTMLVDTNAPAYRQRLAELLAQPAANPMPAAESRDFQPPVPSIFDKTKQPT